MSKKLDVNRLIAEVRKRPALWDVRLAEYKDRAASALLWREIGKIVGCDVEHCKRKWKNLRDAYRAEVRRTERRVQRLKLEGHDDPKVSDSKWAFFKPMSFMSDCKRKRYSTPTAELQELSNESHELCTAETSADDHLGIDDYCQVKMEHHTTDEESDLKHDFRRNAEAAEKTVAASTTPDDDEEANDKLFEQFQSVATPQAARRLSGTLTLGGSIGNNSPPASTSTAAATALASTTAVATIVNSNGNGNSTKNTNCKCSQREDQVHFLEDLEREEQQLMQSTRRDITRANNISFFGDSDYNFLVSFLPQMKRLSELQNLQFRAKMSELMLHIMAQPNTAAAAAAVSLPAFGCISTTTPGLQHHHTLAHHAQSPLHPLPTTRTPASLQQHQPHVTEATTTMTWLPMLPKQTERQQDQ